MDFLNLCQEIIIQSFITKFKSIHNTDQTQSSPSTSCCEMTVLTLQVEVIILFGILLFLNF